MQTEITPFTCIVVPCFNEAVRLRGDLLLLALEEQQNLTLMLVDDGSRDDTRKRLEALRQQCPARVKTLGLDRNQGKAEAVRRGMLAAFETQPALAGYFDADLATPLSEVCSMTRLFDDEHVELVMGSRVQLLGRDVHRSAWRHYLGRIYASSASLLLGLGVYDTQCGAKLFRNTRAVRSLFAQPFSANWSFDVEILMRMQLLSREGELPSMERCVVEYPLRVWRDVSGSKLGPRSAVEAAYELAKLFRKYPR